MVKIGRPRVALPKSVARSRNGNPRSLNRTSKPSTHDAEYKYMNDSVKPVKNISHVTHNVMGTGATIAKYGIGAAVTIGGGGGVAAAVLNFLGGVEDNIVDTGKAAAAAAAAAAEYARQQLTDAENAALAVMHGAPGHISGITDGAVGAFTGNVTTVLVFGLTVFLTYEFYRNFS